MAKSLIAFNNGGTLLLESVDKQLCELCLACIHGGDMESSIPIRFPTKMLRDLSNRIAKGDFNCQWNSIDQVEGGYLEIERVNSFPRKRKLVIGVSDDAVKIKAEIYPTPDEWQELAKIFETILLKQGIGP